jgi:simple sugar transport system ATP-binding protein
MEQEAVVIKDLSKSFGSVQANRNISIDVRKGEILALLGENGSGKSTLVNMLAGIYAPESGSIYINGKPCNFSSPQDAIAAGIGMVHQHFKLVEVMDALENITLGEKNGGFFISRAKIKNKILNLEKQYGFTIDPDKKIYSMSVSEKQTVEIIKMLYHGAKVLILDEPTAVLTPQETEKLFDILQSMKKQGCSIIIITHKLGEVMRISDRVTVLRKGKLSGTVNTAETTQQQLAEMMVGSSVSLEIERAKVERSLVPLLEVTDLTVRNGAGAKALNEVTFNLYGGEILGVAGIVGSGQKELCETITGMTKAEKGSVLFCKEELLTMTPLEIKQRGVRMNFVPEDRLGMGLVAGMDITDNVLLRSYNDNKGIFVDRTLGKEKAEQIVERYDIATPSIHHIVKQLSGGNIQKVLLGRELEMQPKLLIASYPFRGLDVGATNTIIGMLNEQKKKGVAILLIAEDLDQMCALCDHLLVLHNGGLMGVVNPETTSKEEIGLMMMGEKKKSTSVDEGGIK